MTSIATYEVVFVLPDCTVITRKLVGARSAHNRIDRFLPHPDPDSIWEKWAAHCAAVLSK
jgi:hypothetical protein